jgi:hypothetical protein
MAGGLLAAVESARRVVLAVLERVVAVLAVWRSDS